MNTSRETSFSKLDIGCGSSKRNGYIGIDAIEAPGVDIVVDFTKAEIPLPDCSVTHFYSAHCFEHLDRMSPVVSEMSRLSVDGAKVEVWTPYSFHRSAFLYGHTAFLNELHWLHLCVDYPSAYKKTTRGTRWLLNEINYVLDDGVIERLKDQGISIDFAVKHMVNIVREFGVFITICHDSDAENPPLIHTYSLGRNQVRWDLSTGNSLPIRSEN